MQIIIEKYVRTLCVISTTYIGNPFEHAVLANTTKKNTFNITVLLMCIYCKYDM